MKTYQTSGSVRAILQVAGPIAISMAIPQVQQFVNTSFLGHYSTLDQSVLGIGGIIFLFLLSFTFGVSNGALIFFSRYSGRNDNIGLGQSFDTLLTSSMIISLVVAVFYFCFIDMIIWNSLESPLVAIKVREYLDVLIYSLPIFIIIQVNNSLLISIGKSMLILRITIVGTLTHIFFDYLLIYGKVGFASYGIIGSGYAAIISDMVMMIMGMFILYNKGMVEFYQLKPFRSYDWGRAVNQLKICFPLILQYLITLGSWLTFFVFIENMGKEYLAASQAARSAMGLCSIFIWSFAGVSNSFTSNLLGQNLVSQARTTIYRIASISFTGTLFFSALFAIFPEEIMTLLSSDVQVVELGVGPLRVLSISILIMALGSTTFNGLIGTGRVWVSISIEVIAVLVYLLFVIYYLLPLPANLTQMWWSEYAYWLVILFCSIIYINSSYFGKNARETDF